MNVSEMIIQIEAQQKMLAQLTSIIAILITRADETVIVTEESDNGEMIEIESNYVQISHKDDGSFQAVFPVKAFEDFNRTRYMAKTGMADPAREPIGAAPRFVIQYEPAPEPSRIITANGTNQGPRFESPIVGPELLKRVK